MIDEEKIIREARLLFTKYSFEVTCYILAKRHHWTEGMIYNILAGRVYNERLN